MRTGRGVRSPQPEYSYIGNRRSVSVAVEELASPLAEIQDRLHDEPPPRTYAWRPAPGPMLLILTFGSGPCRLGLETMLARLGFAHTSAPERQIGPGAHPVSESAVPLGSWPLEGDRCVAQR